MTSTITILKISLVASLQQLGESWVFGVHRRGATFGLKGHNLCCRCDTYHGGDISCSGSKDVARIGWLTGAPLRATKAAELQAVHPAVLLPAR